MDMIQLYFNRAKGLIALAGLLLFSISIEAQTVVEVVVDQPEKLEVIVSDDLFTQSGDTLIFGENVTVTGGLGPFQYSWYKDESLIGSSQIVKVSGTFESGLYSLLLTDANNCFVKVVATPVYDEFEEDLVISVYPVPAARSIYINPNGINEELDLTIINSNGGIVLKKPINGESRIDIDFPSGIYYLRFKNKKGELAGINKIIVL